jgi:hypothetical protein
VHTELKAVEERVVSQTAELTTIVEALDEATFQRRPAEGRWSVAEHIAHVVRAVRPYLEPLRRALAKGRARRRPHDGGPFRRTWLGRTFVANQEPPPRRRGKTFGVMKPPEPSALPREATLAAFRGAQEELLEIVRGAEGVDLGRSKVASPMLPLPVLRFPVIEALEGIAAHTARHVWLIREALGQMGIEPATPASPTGPSAPAELDATPEPTSAPERELGEG